MGQMSPQADDIDPASLNNNTVVSYSSGSTAATAAAAQVKFTSRADSVASKHSYGIMSRTTTLTNSSSFNSAAQLPQQTVLTRGRSLRDRMVLNRNSSSSSSAASAAGAAADAAGESTRGGDSSETSRRHRNRNTRVLVTGASGFIGSHCVKRLLERGYRVRGTVRDISKRALTEPLYLLSRKRREQLELVEAELLDKHSWQRAVDGCDFVVHVASPVPLEEPVDRFDVIRQAVQGTLNVLEACRDSGCVRHVVMTSSSVTMYDSFNPPPRGRNLLGRGSFSNAADITSNGVETTPIDSPVHQHRRDHRSFNFLSLRSKSTSHKMTPSPSFTSSRSQQAPVQYRHSIRSSKAGRSISAHAYGGGSIRNGTRKNKSIDEQYGDDDRDENENSDGSDSASTNGGGIIGNSALKKKVRALAALAQRGKTDERLHDENEWTDLDDGRWHMAYTESKVRAEKFAWDFYYSLPSEKRFAFTIIAPTITLGPVLHGRDGSSLVFMLYLLTSGSPFMPHMGIETCDVRDVAEAHARALEMESSHGRRIVIYTQTMWYAEIADAIRREFGPLGYSVPTVKAPAWLLRAMARFSPHLRLVVARLNRFPRWNNKSMREDLQLEPRVIDVSIIDMMHSLIQRGDVKMTRRYRDWLDRNPHAVFFPRTESNV